MLKKQYATSTRFTRDTMALIVAAHLDGSKPIHALTHISYNCESFVRIAYVDATSAFFYSQHSEGNAVPFIRRAFLNYGPIDKTMHSYAADNDAVYRSIEHTHRESPSAVSFERDRDYLFFLATATYFE